MVLHGMATTVGVTLEMMILHGQAVMRGSRRALVVVDMPFGSYEASPQDAAYFLAVRVMRRDRLPGGEGGIRCGHRRHHRLSSVDRGIPVMGHVGLRPQAVNVEGGFKAKGRIEAERTKARGRRVRPIVPVRSAIVIEGVARGPCPMRSPTR